MATGSFRVGDWIVEPIEGVVERAGERRHLRPKVMDFLLLLVETPGSTVSKATILARLWPDISVEEGALARCVSELRSVFGDDPRNPRYVQTRYRRGYRLVARVTEIDEEAEEKETAKETEEAPSPRADTVVPRSSKRRLVVGGGVVVLVAAILVPILTNWGGTRPSGSMATSGAVREGSPRVVILGATQLEGQASHLWMGRAVAHLLTTELASTTDLRLVPADVSSRSNRELAASHAGTTTPEALARLRDRFAVDWVVSGHYVVDAGRANALRLDLLVTDTRSGEIRAAVVEHGSTDHLGEVVTLAALRLRKDLGLGAASTAQAQRDPDAPQPAHPPSYYQGLLLLERFEARSARSRFQQAIATEPDAVWAYLALAEAWAVLGYDRNAAEAVTHALRRAGGLRGEERLWFEGRAHALATDWNDAVERFGALCLLAPDNLEYRLTLVDTLVRAGRMAEAWKIIDQANATGEQATDGAPRPDPRWALLSGEVALAMGDPSGALGAARSAMTESRDLRAPAVENRAQDLEARALYASGDVPAAERALDAVRRRFALARDRAGEARAHVTLSLWLSLRSEPTRARASAQAGLALSREIGDRSGEGDALRVLGLQAFVLEGQMAGEAYLREALAIARETGDRSAEANALSSLGIAFLRFGVDEPVLPYFQQALTIRRELGDRERIGSSLMDIGRLARRRGDLAASRAAFDEALTVVADADLASKALIAFNLGRIHAAKGEITEAELDLEHGRALFRQLNNDVMARVCSVFLGQLAVAKGNLGVALALTRETLPSTMAQDRPYSKLALGRVLLAAGEKVEAERYVRQAFEETGAGSKRDVRPAATEALARVLLETGRAVEADEIVKKLGGPPEGVLVWSRFEHAVHDVTRIRVDAALGRHEEALARARGLRAYFEERGALALVLEVDVAMLELDARMHGRLDEQHAKSVIASARGRGYEQIVRRVEALRVGVR